MRQNDGMKRIVATSVLASLLVAPALASDRPLSVTIDGRPITRGTSMARIHNGVAYANLTELVRTYNGIVTTTRGATTVTVRTRRATFVPGSSSVVLNDGKLPLRDPAFMDRGALYVPLAFFVKRVGGGRIAIDRGMKTADISIAVDPVTPPTAKP